MLVSSKVAAGSSVTAIIGSTRGGVWRDIPGAVLLAATVLPDAESVKKHRRIVPTREMCHARAGTVHCE
jgi:hypothetical protein